MRLLEKCAERAMPTSALDTTRSSWRATGVTALVYAAAAEPGQHEDEALSTKLLELFPQLDARDLNAARPVCFFSDRWRSASGGASTYIFANEYSIDWVVKEGKTCVYTPMLACVGMMWGEFPRIDIELMEKKSNATSITSSSSKTP